MNNDNANIPTPSHDPDNTNPMDEHAMNYEEKLTAYALGELTGSGATEFEAQIANDDSARAEVEAIRAVAGQLTTVMADEPAPALTDQQREMLLSEVASSRLAVTRSAAEGSASPEESSPVIYTFRAARWVGVGLAAAAALGLAFVWPMMTTGDRANQPGSEYAINSGGRDGQDGNLELQGRFKKSEDETYLGTKLGVVDAAREREPAEVKLAYGLEEQLQAIGGEVAQNELHDRTAGLDDFAAKLRRNDEDATARHSKNVPATQAAGQMAQPPAPASVAPGEANSPPVAGGQNRSNMIPPARPVAPVTGSTASNGGNFGGGGGSGGGGMGGGGSIDDSRGETDGRLRKASEPLFVGSDMRSDSGVMEYPADWRPPARESGLARLRVDLSREGYAALIDNPFTTPNDQALSTFSIDVDTASYSNIRRIINDGSLPPAGAVRIEELINYFTYDYETPKEDAEAPFTVDCVATSCPWEPKHRLVRIGLKGYEIPMDNRPATNLVFLIDVSGSMNQANKLPLVKQSLNMLVNELNGDDRVALAVYAGSSGLALDSTPLYEKEAVINAINSLKPGGSTHGSAGIKLAYDVAQKNFIEGGANRVILCTDGDFNVGVTSDDELIKLIEEKRKSGVFLSVLGFGAGNYQDTKMEQLSNHGNGVSAYIDTLAEARKVLVDQGAGTLVTIAKDVKIQVDFNPEKVAAYRLIGYANRMLAAEDFNNDAKDAGEIGAGHTVTALYEIIPTGLEIPGPSVDPSKYAKTDTDDAKAAEDAEIEKERTAIIGRDLLLIRQLRDEGHYDEALQVIDEILFLDENHAVALKLKNLLTAEKLAASILPQETIRETASEKQVDVEDQIVLGGRVIEEFAPMTNEMLTVRLRFKKPDSDVSTRFDVPLVDSGSTIDSASQDVQFAAAVAEFGMLLRNAEYMGSASWAQVLDLAETGRGEDIKGYRAQFIELVQKARQISDAQK